MIDNKRDRLKSRKIRRKIRDLLNKEILNLKPLEESLLKRKRKSKNYWNKKTESMKSLLKKKRRDYIKLKKICLKDTRKISKNRKIGITKERTRSFKMRKR